MRVEAIAVEAGAALRAEYDAADVPPLPPGRVRHPALRAVAIGLVVALVVGGLVAVVRSGRDAMPSGRHGSMWARRSAARAFGASTTGISIVGTPNGFVATGIVLHGKRTTAAVWTSSDGERWSRVPTRGLPRDPQGSPGSVFGHGRYLSMWDGSVYLSRDLRSWRRVLAASESSLFERLPYSYLVTVRDGFQLARGSDGSEPIAYESSDGVRWHRIPRSTTPGVVTGLPAGFALGTGFVSRKLGTGEPIDVFGSKDRTRWTRIGGLPPRTVGRMASDRSRRVLYAIQFEAALDQPGGALLRTRDGTRWNEITSFSDRFPEGNPDHLVQSGRWWVYGGNEGGLRRRETMWVTPDLEHWIEMPKAVRVAGSSGIPVAAHGGIVVGYGYSQTGPGSLWIWHRPTKVPELVKVSGVLQSSGGPPGTGSIVHAVKVFRGTELVSEAAVAADGAYALDLAPGRYELRTACQKKRIRVRQAPITWSDVCQIK